jgi:energy-coupling factor transporter ATP-binding protein EcfA2
MGAGLPQFIMVLANVAIKEPELLVIDEPELNLHPTLQLKFLEALAKYAKHVIFATHSLGLARAAERVYSVTRKNDRSTIQPLPGTRSYSELLGEMSFEAYREVGFEQVLCVEGVTDVLPVQIFLRKLGLDQKFVIIPLGGEQLIMPGREYELAELKRISTRVAILIDSEKHAADPPLSEKRVGFVKSCDALNYNIHVMQRRALEHYLSDVAIKAELGPDFSALAPYQELSTLAQRWRKGTNWRIAQHMTREELLATDIGQWLSKL